MSPALLAVWLPFSPPEASPYAKQVDLLCVVLLVLAVFFTLLVAGLLLFFAFRYRAGSTANRDHPTVDNYKLETFWTVVPLVMGLVIFVWAAKLYLDAYEPPADAQEVLCVGKQWMWKFQHAEGKREIDALHVPLGRTIRVKLTSQDVIHSLFVPALRIKRDAVPGRYTTIWFKPIRIGTYPLYCAEYCGANHSLMVGTVTVMQPADYRKWLADLDGQPLGTTGADLFQSLSCVTCHTGPDRQAPNLGGLAGSMVKLTDGRTVIADDNYLRDSILNPKLQVVAGYKPVMPTFQGLLSEEDLAKLIHYIKSLPPAPAESTGAAKGMP